MSGGKIKGSLSNAWDVIKSSNDPRRTYDPRNVLSDSMRVTGNELGNWSPNTFGSMSQNIQGQNAAQEQARIQAQHQQALQMAQQLFGGAYQGGTAVGGGGSGMMAAPVTVMPQQQANQGLPMLQNMGAASRGDIGAFLNQLRQGMPSTGYNPVLPRTVMPTGMSTGLPMQPGQAVLPSGGTMPLMPQQNNPLMNILRQQQMVR